MGYLGSNEMRHQREPLMDYPSLVLAAQSGDTGMPGKACGAHMGEPYK